MIEAVNIFVSICGITVTAFLVKRILSEYDDFKTEVKDDFRRLEEKIIDQSMTSAQTHLSTNEKIAELQTGFVKHDAQVRIELQKTNSFIETNDKAYKKCIDIIKSIYSRLLTTEKEIETLKVRLDSGNIFVKTKKD